MRDEFIRKSQRTGLFYVRVPVAGTKRHKWISTGEREIKRAREVVAEAGVDRLTHLHNARALTHETIALVTLGRKSTCEHIVTLWKEHLAIAVADRTAETYGVHVQTFIDQLGCHTQPLSWIPAHELFAYVNDGESSTATANGRLSALKSLYRFANAKGFIVGNAAELIALDHRHMTVEQKEVDHVEPVTEEQYQTMLANLPRPYRDWVILGYCCGLRLGDAACLEYPSFTPEHIVVYPSKSVRAKRLALPLNDPLIARPELTELIALLLSEKGKGTYVYPLEQDVFQTPRRNRFSQDFKRKIIRLGILDRTFHSLRVSFARRLMAAGRTIYDIAKALAHSSIETTRIYTGEKS